MVADHGGLATASADGGWHTIIELYDRPTPMSTSRTDREGFTAQAIPDLAQLAHQSKQVLDPKVCPPPGEDHEGVDTLHVRPAGRD